MPRSGGGTHRRSARALLKSVSLFLAARKSSLGARARPLASHQAPQKPPREHMSVTRHPAQSTANANLRTPAHFFDVHKSRTHFSRSELDALCRIYRRLANLGEDITSGDEGENSQMSNLKRGLDRATVGEVLHCTLDLPSDPVLSDRLVSALARGSEGRLSLDSWLRGLSVLLRGTVSEKAFFCFSVYDLNSDGYITKDEIFHLLRHCLVKQPQDEDPDEAVREIADLALRHLDADRDGRVSLVDFEKAVHREPLLLQAFGQCLPSDEACFSFLSSLAE